MTPELAEYLRLLPRIVGLDEALHAGDAYRLYHGMPVSLSLGVALERTCGLIEKQTIMWRGLLATVGYLVRQWLRAHAECFVRRDGGECGWEIRDERAGSANGTIQQLANVRIGLGLAYLVRAMDRCGMLLGAEAPIRNCLDEALTWRMKADAAFCEAAITKLMNDKASYLAAWLMVQRGDVALAARIADAWIIPTDDGGIMFGDRRTIPPYGSWSTQKCGAEVLMLLELGEHMSLPEFSFAVTRQFRKQIRTGTRGHVAYTKYPDGTGGIDHQWCDPSLWFLCRGLVREAGECADFLRKAESDPLMRDDPTAKALWGDSTRMLIAACAM